MDGSGAHHTAIRGLETVCRCNNIKYRTIERCIREGAWSLSQVAARSTATTGHCGGSCTPDILQMILEHAPKHSRLSPETSADAPAPADAWWLRKK